MKNPNVKVFANTYLYNHSKYEDELLKFIMKGERIDTGSVAFEDVMYEVKKRQISNNLYNVLASKNVVLILSESGIQRAFKIFTSKDIRYDKTMKTFIDVSGCMTFENGVYKCHNIDVLISYLVSAMTNIIYYKAPNEFLNNTRIAQEGALCFAKLFTHIVDYVTKVSVMPSAKGKCLYLAAAYYLENILGKDRTATSSVSILTNLSGLSEREISIIDLQIKETTFSNLKSFVIDLADILQLNITTDVVVEKWLYQYGMGTQFALELFPSFSSMLTDAYIGAYINNQNTIEKIADKNMVNFSKAVLQIGDGLK